MLIGDDHPAFRSSSHTLLEKEGFAVVGEAKDGASALCAVTRLHPDVVLLDVQLPDLDGFQVAARIAAERDAPAVILISSRDAMSYGRQVERSPALGFLSKAELSGTALTALLSG